MQFNMSHPDAIFDSINDLLELSEYALIPISSIQAVSLAYIKFVKNLILLQDLLEHATAIQQSIMHGRP